MAMKTIEAGCCFSSAVATGDDVWLLRDAVVAVATAVDIAHHRSYFFGGSFGRLSGYLL